MRKLIDIVFESLYDLLTESDQRIKWLVDNFGKKLAEKYNFDKLHLPDVVINTIETQDGDEISEKILNYIIKHDPTNNKAYSRWIVSRYLKDNQNLEDINDNLKNTLDIFQKASRSRRIDGNIDKYKTFSELFDIVEPFVIGDKEVSSNMDRKNNRQTKIERLWDVDDPMRKEATILHDSDNYMVLIPQTALAASYFGKNTSWCTTSNMFDYYNNKGKLYIILRRKDGRKWQFHFESEQFMDEADRQINIVEFFKDNREAYHAIGEEKFIGLNGTTLEMFSPDIISKADDATLIRAIVTVSDLSNVPYNRITKGLYKSWVARVFSRHRDYARYDENRDPYNADKKIPKNIKQLSDVFKKKFGKEVAEDICKSTPLYIQMISEPSEEIVRVAANDLSPSISMEIIPKPLPVSIAEYLIRRLNKNIDEAVNIDDIPQGLYQNANLLAWSILKEWETAKDLSWITDKHIEAVMDLADSIVDVSNYRNQTQDQYINFLKEIPEKFLTQERFDHFYEYRRHYDSNIKTFFEKVLSVFPNETLPQKRISYVKNIVAHKPNFVDIPIDMRENDVISKWMTKNYTKWSTISAQYINQQVIDAAFDYLYKGLKNDDIAKRQILLNVLGESSPDILKSEYIIPNIEKHFSTYDITHKMYDSLPIQYKSNKYMIEYFISKGGVDLTSRFFPEDSLTPDNIYKFYSLKAVIKYESRGSIILQSEYQKVWDEFPEVAKTPYNIAAFVEADFGPVLSYVEDKYLTEPVLQALLDTYKGSSYSRSRTKFGEGELSYHELIKRFPDSAYSPEVAKKAVACGFQIPEHLHENDDVKVEKILKQKVTNWSSISKEIFIKAIETNAWDSFWSFKSIPEDNPLRYDQEIALLFLDIKKHVGIIKINPEYLKTVYEQDKFRVNWKQRHYELSAGDIIPLNNIPKEFINNRVINRAMMNDPESSKYIDDPISWLNNNERPLKDDIIYSFMTQGLVETNDGWVDAKTKTHVKAKNGSYYIFDMKKGKGIVFFDTSGQCIDVTMTVNSLATQYSNRIFASSSSPTGILKHRSLIIETLDKFGFSRYCESTFSKMAIYYDYNTKDWIPVENMKRTTIGKISYVETPERYGDHYYLFSDNKILAKVSFERHGRGVMLMDSALTKNVELAMECSSDIAKFLEKINVTSGNNSVFKESSLYLTLGLRGLGKAQWTTLLEDKLSTKNGYTLWKSGKKISITNNQTILLVARMTKEGFTIEYSTDDTPKDLYKLLD